MLIPFPNYKVREGEPQTVQAVWQGEADKEIFDFGMESWVQFGEFA
jgi:hypothetical protein